MMLIVMYICGGLSVFGIFWMLFIEPFESTVESESTQQPAPRPGPKGLAARIEQNHIIIPEHEAPEPAPQKRIRKLKPGTTDIAVTNPQRVEELKRLAKQSTKKISR